MLSVEAVPYVFRVSFYSDKFESIPSKGVTVVSLVYLFLCNTTIHVLKGEGRRGRHLFFLCFFA